MGALAEATHAEGRGLIPSTAWCALSTEPGAPQEVVPQILPPKKNIHVVVEWSNQEVHMKNAVPRPWQALKGSGHHAQCRLQALCSLLAKLRIRSGSAAYMASPYALCSHTLPLHSLPAGYSPRQVGGVPGDPGPDSSW